MDGCDIEMGPQLWDSPYITDPSRNKAVVNRSQWI